MIESEAYYAKRLDTALLAAAALQAAGNDAAAKQVRVKAVPDLVGWINATIKRLEAKHPADYVHPVHCGTLFDDARDYCRQLGLTVAVEALGSRPDITVCGGEIHDATIRQELKDKLIRLREHLLGRPPLPFVPTPFQSRILDVLKDRALKQAQLAAIVSKGDTKRLYRPGGLKELRAHSLVAHKHGVGFYRPDAPPPISL